MENIILELIKGYSMKSDNDIIPIEVFAGSIIVVK